MTQHRWKTVDGYDCMSGWDRPLQYFFLTISRTCDCDGNEECPMCEGNGEVFIYDNLADRQLLMGRMTWDDLNQQLRDQLTAWPSELLLKLDDDRRRNAGNELSEYESVGEVRHEP